MLKYYWEIAHFWRQKVNSSFDYFRILKLEFKLRKCKLFRFKDKDFVILRQVFLKFIVLVVTFVKHAFWLIKTLISRIEFLVFIIKIFADMFGVIFLFNLSVWLKLNFIAPKVKFYLEVNLSLNFHSTQWCQLFFKDQGFCSLKFT